MLNFYFLFFPERLELTRRLKHRKNAKQNGVSEEFSSDSSSSDSDSSSSDSSDSSSDSEAENGENDFPVINDSKIAETISC